MSYLYCRDDFNELGFLGHAKLLLDWKRQIDLVE